MLCLVVYADCQLLDFSHVPGLTGADRALALTELWQSPARVFTLGPGCYEIEEVSNPAYGSGGEPWYVLVGTYRGLPCSQWWQRRSYEVTCTLRVEIRDDPPATLELVKPSPCVRPGGLLLSLAELITQQQAA
ncbi:MAG: hypothetical protein WAZ14_03325 [Patescibacteria group bacterium]